MIGNLRFIFEKENEKDIPTLGCRAAARHGGRASPELPQNVAVSDKNRVFQRRDGQASS